MGRNKNTEKFNNIILGIFLLLVDYAAIILAEESAFVLRNSLVSVDNLHLSWLNFWVVFPILYLAFMNIGQLYSRRAPFYKEVEKIFYACCYGTAAVVFVLYVAQLADNTSRLFTVFFGIFTFIFLTVIRYAVKKFLIRHQLLQIPVLLIGAGKTAELLVRAITDDPGMGYRIVGLLEDNFVQQGVLERYPLLGTFAEAEEVIQQTGVKHVFIAAPGMEEQKLGWLIYRVQPLVENIAVIPNLVGVPVSGVEVESIFNEKLLILRLKNNLARPLNRWLKSAFDYVLTLVGTIAISPILLFIAIWIYKDSPGPVIFKHIRIGKNNRSFACYKFRTMCVDAEKKIVDILASDVEAREEWYRDFKLKNDPRITSSGHFLRRTSLDELPQIFNVLKGDMSLVGPRPVIQEELERYGEFIGDYIMVKPGITGMWQVSGRSDTTYEERVQMDSWYVRNWSLWIDIMLLWRTVSAVILRKGAY